MVVPQTAPHKIPRGDEPVETENEKIPDQTFQLGNATCHVFAPKNLSPEEIERRELNLHKAIARILSNSNHKVLEGA